MSKASENYTNRYTTLMRILKYIIPLLGGLVIGFGYYSFVTNENSTLILTLTLLFAVALSIFELIWVKNQIKSKKLIQVNHPKKYKWLKPTISSLIHGSLSLLTFNFLIYKQEHMGLLNLSLVFILFLVVSFSSTFRHEIAFYIDSTGLIQPEIFNKNINWDNLKNVDIQKHLINFNLKNQDYSFKITETDSEKIKTWYNT